MIYQSLLLPVALSIIHLLLSWLVDEKRNVYGFQLEEEEKKVFIIVNLLVVPDLKDPEVMTHIGAIKLSSPYL